MNLLADALISETFVGFDAMSALLGAFFFYCLANPHRVKNRTQFWGVFGVLVLIVFFYTLRLMLYNSAAGQVFTGVMIGILQVAGLILTVLYVGGLSPSQMAGELRDAAEEFRNKPPKVTPIIPITGEQPKERYETPAEPPRYNIELPKVHGQSPSVDED